MVRRLDKITRTSNGRLTNEGADCFTDFFQERHPMNENPTKPFFQFMENNEVDFQKGSVKRRK